VAKTWTCPACGTQNAMDAAECQSCGRWASIFDLERVSDDDTPVAYEPVRTQAPEPEPVVISETHVGAAERARATLERLRGTTGDTTAQEVDPRRSGHVVRWILVALAVFWFVVIPLLGQLR
jgi:predicted ATP-dependent serine protease